MKKFLRRFPNLTALLAALLIGAAGLLQVGCAPTARKVLAGANDLQDTAARAFNEAKDAERIAGAICGEKARTAHLVPDPVICAQLGVPLPYDPVKLNALAGPINAAYDVIREAHDVEALVAKGVKTEADLALALAKISQVLPAFYQSMKDAGLKVDNAALDKWLGLLGGAR